MKTRATGELGSLSDPDFFERIAEGMGRCIRNAASLLRDARGLGRKGRLRASNVMLAFGHEEIAKYLILLDAVRCPRTKQKERVVQLRRFNEHLAKGMYIELYGGYPVTYGQVRNRAESLRAEFFLDGPSEVDWIFRNTILAQREQSIYVDFVKADDESRWESPNLRNGGLGGLVSVRSYAHDVALALHTAGFSSPKALATIAGLWRDFSVGDETRWEEVQAKNFETLKALDAERLRRTLGGDLIARTIVGKWSFPLYELNLSERKVDLDQLRARQAKWGPSDW